MDTAERRHQLLEVLGARQQETCVNLALEFHVSERTIRRDIAVLMCSYPIETVRGRHGGGVRVMDGHTMDGRGLNHRQVELLKRLRTQLGGDDLLTINSILFQFSRY